MQITVRQTVHGPILSDVVADLASAGATAPVEGKPDGGGYDVSLAWTGLRPGRTADAIFAARHGAELPAVPAAARDFAVPSQNLVYADVDGHIGYQAPGQVPVRASATPGTPPGLLAGAGLGVPQYDWKGFVPFDADAHVVRPAGGLHRRGQPGGHAPARRRSSPPSGTTATAASGSVT